MAGNKSEEGSFRTLADANDDVKASHKQEGLFIIRFEYGSCASQNPENGIGPSLLNYTTVLREVKDKVNFAVMNGDWPYEEKRDYPLFEWL